MIKRLIPWNSQPQYPVSIDPAYAEYVSSARIWSLGASAPSEVVQNDLSAFAKTGTIELTASPGGVGVKGDGSTGYHSRPVTVVPQAMWIAAQFVANSTASSTRTVYALGSAADGAHNLISNGNGNGPDTKIITQFRAVDGGATIIKTGPAAVAGQIYTVVAVYPSASKSDAYLYINGIKYTTDAPSSADITFSGATTLVNEAVGALKRATVALYSFDTVLFTARGVGQIPESLAKNISENPYQSLLQRQERNILVAAASGQVDYSLTCSAGSYSYTGVAATLTVNHNLVCATGAYTYSGVSAALAVNHSLSCSSGSYSYSGVASILSINRSIACAAGSYTYSGVSASLSATHGLSCDAGAYTYTGVASTLAYTPGTGAYVLTCDSGSYAYTGQAATLSVNHQLTCAAGAYAYAGVSASLQIAHGLTCSAGAYTYAGQSASLSVKRSLACATGTYDYIGNTATLDYLSGTAAISYALTCAVGAYAYTGQAATLLVVGSWSGEIVNMYSPIAMSVSLDSPISKSISFTSYI